MNFMEAIKCLKEGKKVRRREWEKHEYWTAEQDNLLKAGLGQGYPNMNFDNFTATDWEICEEDGYCGRKMDFEYYCDKEHPCRDCKKKVKEDDWNWDDYSLNAVRGRS